MDAQEVVLIFFDASKKYYSVDTFVATPTFDSFSDFAGGLDRSSRPS